LLLLGLLVLVLGVFGAVYFQQHAPAPATELATNRPPPQGPVAPAPLAALSPTVTAPENLPPAQAVRPPESTPAQTAATPATAPPEAAAPAPPQAPGIDTPSPDISAQRLAQIAPTAAPADIAAAGPRYWVEFGAYDGSFYADRLKRKLTALGIAATVTEAPGRYGRRYLRVRTTGDSDRDDAIGLSAKARAALQIVPLLHRAAAVSPAPTRAAAPVAKGNLWVQFGAFRRRADADRVVDKLGKSDVQTSVIKIRNDSRPPLYLIRASGLADRSAAVEVAQRGAVALHTKDVLIGESVRAQALHPRPPPR